ncbi:hypothetical protein [Roseibium sp.]|uniref:hypothetical protein n=1 Tax=Roseibium sp. TaxID=1936156 RepID=UPI003A982DA0
MSLVNDPEVRRILDKARVLSRAEREQAINMEIERLGADDLLALNLTNMFQADRLTQVPDAEFDLAALVAWKLIYKLRESTGTTH